MSHDEASTYLVKPLVGGPDGTTMLSAEEFHLLRRARFGVVGAVAIEHKLSIVLGNYIEFEQELHSAVLHDTVYQRFDYSEMIDASYVLCRRLTNLLSSCRMYKDHVKHEIKMLYGRDSDCFNNTAAAFHNAYDSALSYRVMEALRNHAQHCDMPLHATGREWNLVETDAGPRSKRRIALNVNVRMLKEEGGFKKAVLDELDAIGGNDIDIKPMVREYIDAHWRVHIGIRTAMATDIQVWTAAIQKRLDAMRVDYPKVETLGLTLLSLDDSDRVLTEDSLYPPFLDHFRKVLARHTTAPELRHTFISSEVINDFPRMFKP